MVPDVSWILVAARILHRLPVKETFSPFNANGSFQPIYLQISRSGMRVGHFVDLLLFIMLC